MNYRKWPAQSVLWLITSIALFVISVGSDLCRWELRGKPTSFGEVVDSLIFSIIIGWATTLSGNARGIGFLTWAATALSTLVAEFQLEKNVHLSPLVDAACDRAGVLFPMFVAVVVMLFWRRRERMKEIRTMR